MKTLTESMRHTLNRLDEQEGDCPDWFAFLRERARKKSLDPIPHDARGDGYSPWDPLYWLGLNKDPDSPETCARAWDISQEDWDRAGEEMTEMLERVGQSGQNGAGIIAFFMAGRRISEFTKTVDKAYKMWQSESAAKPSKVSYSGATDADQLPGEELSF